MSTARRILWPAAASLAALVLAGPAPAAPRLEQALIANASAVVKKLQAMGCRNVAALKFLATTVPVMTATIVYYRP